jgi:hypothetical protein
LDEECPKTRNELKGLRRVAGEIGDLQQFKNSTTSRIKMSNHISENQQYCASNPKGIQCATALRHNILTLSVAKEEKVFEHT